FAISFYVKIFGAVLSKKMLAITFALTLILALAVSFARCRFAFSFFSWITNFYEWKIGKVLAAH
ncbi:MAG: hypothetical protein QMD20_02015, partial [Candidatus Bathyarchaeia archaeon]|nr:hypothetical protein [Candidatus Bathyarchaeia archaeon]